MTTRRTVLGLAATAVLTMAGPAGAQPAYPLRPITLVVPFPAGGSTDLVARLVAEKMSEAWASRSWSRTVAGPAATSARPASANADPDGYTILMGTVATHALNPALYKKMPYDPVTDFAPISLLVWCPTCWWSIRTSRPRTCRS